VNGSGNATLGGTGSIVGAGGGGNVVNNTSDGIHSFDLTLGAPLTITGNTLNFGTNFGTGAIINNSSMNATGGNWNIASLSTNNGTMSVGAGATLNVNTTTLTNAGTISVAAGGIFTGPANLNSSGTLSVAGKLRITGQLNLAAGSNTSSPASGVGVIRCQSLVLGAGVSLDLHDNDLIVDYSGASPIGTWNGSSYTGMIGQVVAGRNGNPGIKSSSASGSVKYLAIAEAKDAFSLPPNGAANFGDEVVDATCVLIKFTYGGDANLDGKINVDDYGRIDFNISLGSRFWYNGDFNFDGKIDVDDYGIIDFNIGIQGPQALIHMPTSPLAMLDLSSANRDKDAILA